MSRRIRRQPACLACLACLLLAHGAGVADSVSVELEGVDGELASNVRALLPLARYADTPLSALNIRNLHAGAEAKIKEALRPFGYYEPQVQSTLNRSGEGQWLARYAITPGEPVIVTDVSVELVGPGADDARLRDVRGALALGTGQILSHPRYEQAKSRLLLAANERGYRDARWTRARMNVDPARHRAAIDLVLDTGPQYRFGELILEQDVLNDELVRRYAPFTPGDPFSTRDLLDFEYALFDSGYFSGVQLEALPRDGDRIPVRLRAQAGPRRAWNLRGGYGTDTGPRVGVGFESRRLNRRGHRARGTLELSMPRIEFTGQYIQPLRRPASDQRSYQLGVLDQRLGDIDSTRYQAAIRESRRDGPWNRNRYLRYAREIDDTSAESNSTNLLIPGYTLVRSHSNDVTYPTRGSYFETDVRGALGAVLSDTSFFAFRADLRLIRPIGERNRLLLRSELGAVAVEDFSQLPASERFFAGGDRSVRGFGLNDLGPVNDLGEVIGGRYLVTGSVEYEHRIVGNWGVGMFVDAGNAFNADDFGLEASAGVGLRWLSPIGMVRVDVAQPFTSAGDGVRLHFTFGPEL